MSETTTEGSPADDDAVGSVVLPNPAYRNDEIVTVGASRHYRGDSARRGATKRAVRIETNSWEGTFREGTAASALDAVPTGRFQVDR